MKRFLAAATVTLGIAGCTAQQQNDMIADARQACTSISPMVQLASLVPDPRVTSIVSFAYSVCGPLANGVAVPTIDANTPAWLGQLAGMLKVLVQK